MTDIYSPWEKQLNPKLDNIISNSGEFQLRRWMKIQKRVFVGGNY